MTLRDPSSKKVVADRVVNFRAGREYSVSNYLVPRLPHTFTVGSQSMYFMQNDIRNGYAPTTNHGVRLQYRYDEAISIYDLNINIGFVPTMEETIKVNENLFTQNRRMMTASAHARYASKYQVVDGTR